jgi:hypothetical protein
VDAGGSTVRGVAPCVSFDLRLALRAEDELWISLIRYARMKRRIRTEIAWRATWARLWNALQLARRLGIVRPGGGGDLFVRGCLDECRLMFPAGRSEARVLGLGDQ